VQGVNDFILFAGLALSSLFAGVIYHFMGWIWINLATLPMILTILLSAIWLHSVKHKKTSGT
ncbi:MAG: MFS transporter, partial [Pseudomonadota bacterium]|nr:MFS transporter [Pseudomonadota bacterium]